MDKTKTFEKHQKYLERLSKVDLDSVKGLRRADPLKNLTDQKQILDAVFECLLNNDPEGAMEMIYIYLEALNKAKHMRNTKLPKRSSRSDH